MEPQDFFDRFTKLLTNIKETNDLESEHDALIAWYAENFLSIELEDVKERIVIDKHAEGIDAIFIVPVAYKLCFIQAKTTNKFDSVSKNFPENDIKKTLAGVRLLLKGDYKGKITPELQNLVDEYHEHDKSHLYKTQIIFIALKQKPVAQTFIDDFKRDFQDIEITFFDFDYLKIMYEEYLVKRDPPPEKISFEIVAEIANKGVIAKKQKHESRIFTCKGKDLAKFYSEYKERMFQQNVRYSLGLRVSKSINTQILATAQNPEKSVNFWYFNNGITVVCTKIDETQSGKLITLHSPQIINGAQTTYALYEALQKNSLQENVEVIVKAIETKDKEFIDNVTLYTNSQNAIRLRDLCSNDMVQDKIQKILFDSYKFFYERKRGELDSLYPTIEAKKNFLGEDFKSKVISNERAAQAFIALYLNKPSQAKSEKGRIFLKDDAGFYDDIFTNQDDIIAEKLLVAFQLASYIGMQKKAYRAKYKQIDTISEVERGEIYRKDFLLHGEYFILSLMKDFLLSHKYNLQIRADIIKLLPTIFNDQESVAISYQRIVHLMEEDISSRKSNPGYYHNKFFKNEQSIGLMRDALKKVDDSINV
ncbi:MAG: AIPR family protein [Elusimicrobia bacterium]|nr:AIPR family protein [Elusimicrobiota bacterium]